MFFVNINGRLNIVEVSRVNKANSILNDIGISKVRLAKYLGVSRQMLYNYLAFDNLNDWPKEKLAKLLALLDIKDEKDISKIKIDNNYIIEVESRLNEGVKDNKEKEILNSLKGFNKKEQELLSDLINLLKERLSDDNSKDMYNAFIYLYHLLQSIENTKEIKYILAYMSKAMGFTDPNEFVFNPDQQFIFESIMFSGMTIYNNGTASKLKLAESHKRFVQDIKMNQVL